MEQREEEGEDLVGTRHIHYFRQIVLKGMQNINSQANHPKRNNDMKKSLDFNFSSSGSSFTPNENSSVTQSSSSSIYVSSLSQPSLSLSSSSSATTAEAVGEGGSMESISMEPLMLSGIYWTLSGLSILKINSQTSVMPLTTTTAVVDINVFSDSSSFIDISSSSLRTRRTKSSFETDKNIIFSSADVPGINVFSCSSSTTDFASSSARSSDSNTSALHVILDTQLFYSLFSFLLFCRQKLPTTPLLPSFLGPPISNGNNSQMKGFAIWGFSSCPGFLIPYTASLLSSMSALQVLSLLYWSSSSSSSIDRRNMITKSFGDWGGMRNFIKFLQTLPSGHFSNFLDSSSGRREGDVRFAFCAVAAMRLIQGLLSLESSTRKPNNNNNNNNNKELTSSDNATGIIDVVALNEWILSCQNIDGGFGCSPGMESHAGTTFCCLATLTLLDSLESLNQDGRSRRLQRWLGDRQLFCGGGVNGRPGKSSDVCYCWWVIASLRMLNIPLDEVFDRDKIIDVILSCQNRKMGGFSRCELPGMMEEKEGSIVENNNTHTSGKFQNSSGASNSFSIFNLKTHETNKEECIINRQDPFHSFFALGALSLIVHEKCEKKIEEENSKTHLVGNEKNLRRRERLRRQLLEIHPVFALPLTLVQEFGLI